MVSKKFKLLLGLLGLMQTVSFAQSTDASWAYDSSKISSKNMPQYNEFVNYQTPYPPKPRSMWELGFGGAYHSIIGADVQQRPGYGGTISLRKALGHVVSIRGAWTGSFNYGLDGQKSTKLGDFGAKDYTPWRAYTKNPDAERAFYSANYKNATHLLSVDAIFSLNNWSHHRGNPKWDWYLFGGPGVYSADVDADARDANGQLYNFSGINYDEKYQDVRKELKNLFDGKYESNAGYTHEEQATDFRNNILKDNNGNPNQLIRIGMSVGGGFAFKLSNRVNIGLEQRFTASFQDEIDGMPSGKANDTYSGTELRLNLNLGDAAKNVEPLWWVNPNNYLYNELNNPKHLKITPPPCADADDDGVCDFLDREPNTPAGCPVDTHGVTKDTDGDGIADCKDKEVLTQKSCFPVDADGVGKCPDPKCCTDRPQVPVCALSTFPTIQFSAGSAKLSSTAQTLLNSVAQQLNANPNCKVKVVGYGASDKRAQQLSWDHVNAVKTYLVEKQGISESRIIFTYGMAGNGNTVDMMATTENGPNTVPAPFPNLKKN